MVFNLISFFLYFVVSELEMDFMALMTFQMKGKRKENKIIIIITIDIHSKQYILLD